MSEWMPIESAPRDGRIIGFMPNRVEGGKPYQAVIWWDDEFERLDWNEEKDDNDFRGGWCAGRVGSWGYEEYAEEHPECWQPLPAPPANKMEK